MQSCPLVAHASQQQIFLEKKFYVRITTTILYLLYVVHITIQLEITLIVYDLLMHVRDMDQRGVCRFVPPR